MQAPSGSLAEMLRNRLPQLVLAPSFLLIVLFVYGFILFTTYLSFSDSRLLPSFGWVGLENHIKLWTLRHWHIAVKNLFIFGFLYIVLCVALGLTLAIFLDQRIRGEGFLRPIYLYPMALSFIVTGTAWKWFLDPGVGIENIVQAWGFENFQFRWIKDRDFAIYTIVIAGVWQTSGFAMAMFLAGLRGIDDSILKAAQVDGASGFTIYRRIVIPMLAPAFLSAIVILGHMAIKSYDLVIALTNGGPGQATQLPATFMYSYSFTRNQMGVGSASALMMFMTIAALVLPYLYAGTRDQARTAAHK